ncbi:MAG: hypothetical protein ACRDN9_01865 [Streptosporangiaceae bacterium]
MSTVPYIAGDVMALEVEGRNNRLRREHMRAFGGRVGLRPSVVDGVLDRLVDVAPNWVGRVGKIGLDDRGGARLLREMTRRRDDLAQG